MDSIEGFILIGGQSRRMGTDKSQLMLDGQSFVERIAGELSAVTSLVSVVGKNADSLRTAGRMAPQSGCPIGDPAMPALPGSATTVPGLKHLRMNFKTVPDIYPGWGALGGVHTALSACAAVWALIVACDFPFVTRQLFARLGSSTENFAAVAPIQSDGIPQPLCALYRVEPCLGRAEQLIKSGERKPIALLQSVPTRWVSFAELGNLEGSDHFFENINTPEDYARVSEKGVGTDDVAMSAEED